MNHFLRHNSSTHVSLRGAVRHKITCVSCNEMFQVIRFLYSSNWSWFIYRMWLLVGTIPTSKMLLVGTVPTSKRLLVSTVPTSKRLLVGTSNFIFFAYFDPKCKMLSIFLRQSPISKGLLIVTPQNFTFLLF